MKIRQEREPNLDLKKARREMDGGQGWSQEKLAIKVGVATSTIERIENGQTEDVLLKTARSIGKAVKKPVDAVFRSKTLKVVNNILGPLLWTLRELNNGGQFYVIHPDLETAEGIHKVRKRIHSWAGRQIPKQRYITRRVGTTRMFVWRIQ